MGTKPGKQIISLLPHNELGSPSGQQPGSLTEAELMFMPQLQWTKPEAQESGLVVLGLAQRLFRSCSVVVFCTMK